MRFLFFLLATGVSAVDVTYASEKDIARGESFYIDVKGTHAADVTHVCYLTSTTNFTGHPACGTAETSPYIWDDATDVHGDAITACVSATSDKLAFTDEVHMEQRFACMQGCNESDGTVGAVDCIEIDFPSRGYKALFFVTIVAALVLAIVAMAWGTAHTYFFHGTRTGTWVYAIIAALIMMGLVISGVIYYGAAVAFICAIILCCVLVAAKFIDCRRRGSATPSIQSETTEFFQGETTEFFASVAPTQRAKRDITVECA